jgi:hypothetical protein
VVAKHQLQSPYGRSLSSFIAKAADYFEMPFSSAVLFVISVVCSYLETILSRFYPVSTRRFLTGVLSVTDPADLIFLISLWMHVVFGTVFRGNYDIFSYTF